MQDTIDLTLHLSNGEIDSQSDVSLCGSLLNGYGSKDDEDEVRNDLQMRHMHKCLSSPEAWQINWHNFGIKTRSSSSPIPSKTMQKHLESVQDIQRFEKTSWARDNTWMKSTDLKLIVMSIKHSLQGQISDQDNYLGKWRYMRLLPNYIVPIQYLYIDLTKKKRKLLNYKPAQQAGSDNLNPQPTEDVCVPRKCQIPLNANGKPVNIPAPKKKKSVLLEETGKNKIAPTKPGPQKNMALKSVAKKLAPAKRKASVKIEEVPDQDNLIHSEAVRNSQNILEAAGGSEAPMDVVAIIEEPEEDDEAELSI